MSNYYAIRAGVFEDRLRFVCSALEIAEDLIKSGNIHGGLHIIKSCRAPGVLQYDEHEAMETGQVIPFPSREVSSC